MAGRPKGQKGFGGRPPGSTNKVTKAIRKESKSTRDQIQYKVNLMLAGFDQEYIQLSPKEKIDAMIKLLSFVVPKLENLKHEEINGGDKEVHVILLGD